MTYFSWKHGIWFITYKKWYVQLKAPWQKPLFSERNRLDVPKATLFGWRLFIGRRSYDRNSAKAR